MLNIDTSKRPVRPAEWAAVLDAIYHAEPADEQTWLEWKSTLNLRSKEQMATIVAKAIIALANRDPVEAATHVAGVGILVIGLEPGNVPGVEQIDNADLDKMLTTYLGADGPVWQPHWDRYQAKTILIIEVFPPAFGDPPHAFRKEFNNIPDGAIYVRRRARSVPADHRDVRRLADRYANRPEENSLDIAVAVDYGGPLSRFTWTDADVDAFIEVERARLLEPLDEVPSTRPRGLTFAGMTLGTDGESRTAQQYKDEVDQYLDQVRLSWPETMRSVAAYVLPTTVFTVTNLSTRNYRQLEVTLHVAGDADAVEVEQDAELDLWQLLPAQPEKWGSQAASLLGATWLPYRPPSMPYVGPVGPATTLERGGSFTLIVRPLDLRPRQTAVLEGDYVVLIPATRTDEVIVSWSATATNVDATARGQFTLAFEGQDVNIFEECIRSFAEPPGSEEP
ncbi:helix-turn-helix domain-containing protein [Micromonospora sp. NPDC018662]|uniref:helix-turn-helix domain-containing protein n=1 Tax=Micromonospora sp. NPDC018662 TaxID=3364238 RepID=UPI0037B5BB36